MTPRIDMMPQHGRATIAGIGAFVATAAAILLRAALTGTAPFA